MASSDPNAPRYLTTEEIDYIISESFNMPGEPQKPKAANTPKLATKRVRMAMYDNNVNLIKAQLSETILTPKAIPDMIAKLQYLYPRAMIEPDSTVGVDTATALGGSTTQIALNSFHSSGSSKHVGSGIDSLRSLINLSQNKYPSCTIHFEDKDLSTEDVLQTRKDIVSLTMADLVKDWDIDFTVQDIDKWWYDAYLELNPTKLNDVSKSFFIRLELDVTKMFKYDISTDLLVKTIEHAGGYDTRVIPGPFRFGILYVYVMPSALEQLSKSHQGINQDNIVNLFFQRAFIPLFSSITFKGIKDISRVFPTEDTTWSIVDHEIKAFPPSVIEQYPDDNEMKHQWIIFVNYARRVRNGITIEKLVRLCKLCGFEIKDQDEEMIVVQTPLDVSASKKPGEIVQELLNDELAKEREYKKAHVNEIYVTYASELLSASRHVFAETNGANLIELLQLQGIDTFHTYSNEIQTIYELFGIEAARNLFLIEFVKVLETADQYVDPRHIMFVADMMFNKGKPNHITFRGISRNKTSFLSLMSMEQAVEVTKNVGLMGRTDILASTSPAIMVNRQASLGTGGNFDVVQDPSFDKEIEELKAKQVKLNANDVSLALEMMDNSVFGITKATVPDESENDIENEIYNSIFGGGEPIAPQPQPQPRSLIDFDLPIITPTIALPPVIDPNLVAVHSNLKLPSIKSRVEETVILQEEPPKKKGPKKTVRIVDEPQIAYIMPDSAHVSTGLEPIPSDDEEELPVPAPRKKFKKLSELRTAAVQEEEPETSTQRVKPINVSKFMEALSK